MALTHRAATALLPWSIRGVWCVCVFMVCVCVVQAVMIVVLRDILSALFHLECSEHCQLSHHCVCERTV